MNSIRFRNKFNVQYNKIQFVYYNKNDIFNLLIVLLLPLYMFLLSEKKKLE